jgi:site-specific recombinase XerD
MRVALANRGSDLRLIQDYLGHRDPKYTVHYTRVAAGRFEGLWRWKRSRSFEPLAANSN